MKSILMSIQPYYAYLEMKGIKTVEMRKTEPKDKEWSGKVKVYVSHNEKSFKRIPKEDREWFTQYVGKVAYEYVVNKVDLYVPMQKNYFIGNSDFYETCLTDEEINNYGKGKDLYGWHISDLKIYNKPKEVNEFGLFCKDFINCKNISCRKDTCRCGFIPIGKAPQNFIYCEDLSEVRE